MSSRLLAAGFLLAVLALGCAKPPSDGSDEFGPNEQRPKQVQDLREKQKKDAPTKP